MGSCHRDDVYGCYACHEHLRYTIRDEHVEEGIYDDETAQCAICGDDLVEIKIPLQTKCFNPGKGENNA